MPVCRDPLVASLRSQGFNTLRVPRKDYLPGVVLFQPRRDGLEVFGPFASAFGDAAGLEIAESAQAEAFSGTTTSSYRRGVALKLASTWLGVPEAGLSSLFNGATKLSFRFGELRILTTSLAAVGERLLAAEPTETLLALPESRLFVVHEVLQAKRIFCLNEADRDGSVSMHAKETLTNMAELGFEVEASKASQGLIVFQSREYHTIGFKAYEVEYADGGLHLRRPLDSTGFTHLDDEEAQPEPALFEDPLL